MARCRLQHSEGAPRRPPHSSHIGVCDIREAAGRERAASTAGNRPLFYFRFGERTFLRGKPPGGDALEMRCPPALLRAQQQGFVLRSGTLCLCPALQTSSHSYWGPLCSLTRAVAGPRMAATPRAPCQS